jgi:hypothetical protein
MSGWEVPEIARLKIINERAAFNIESRNSDLAWAMLEGGLR